MSLAEVSTLNQRGVRWGKPVLIAGGVVWIVRAGLELAFQPNYWNPQGVVDYAAVAGSTLALLLLALGVWSIHLGRQQASRTLSSWLWIVGLTLACGGALAAGLANFFEDWLSIKAFGDLFVWGSLALFIGLLLAGISTIRARDVSRWTGWLLIACALGLGTIDSGGGFVIGLSLIGLGAMQKGPR